MLAARNCLYTPTTMRYATSGAGTTGSKTNPSWSHTIPPGCRLLVAASNFVTANPTACKVGSTSMTLHPSGLETFSSGTLAMYWIFNPPEGVQTIAFTSSSAFVAGGSVAYIGGVGVAHSGTGVSNITTGTVGVTGTAPAGSMTVCAYANANGSGSFSSFTGKQRFNDPFSSGVNYAFFMGDQPMATAPTINAPTSGQDTAILQMNFI